MVNLLGLHLDQSGLEHTALTKISTQVYNTS